MHVKHKCAGTKASLRSKLHRNLHERNVGPVVCLVEFDLAPATKLSPQEAKSDQI